MGPDWDHLALSGRLVMELDEWKLFSAALLLGAERSQQQLGVITEEESNKVPQEEKLG